MMNGRRLQHVTRVATRLSSLEMSAADSPVPTTRQAFPAKADAFWKSDEWSFAPSKPSATPATLFGVAFDPVLTASASQSYVSVVPSASVASTRQILGPPCVSASFVARVTVRPNLIAPPRPNAFA